MKNKELNEFIEVMLILGVFIVNTAAVLYTMTAEVTINCAIAYSVANVVLSYLIFKTNKGGN